MEAEELKKSIDAVNLRLDELAKQSEKKSNRDFWINLISSIVLPAAIAISGYWFSDALKTRDLQQESAQEKIQADQERLQLNATLANQRLETFKFVTPLIDVMSSGDSKKQAYMRHVITVLMPDEAPQIFKIVIDSKQGNTTELQKSVDSAQVVLVKNLFSQNAQIRTSNANQIMVNWYTVDTIIPVIINYAMQHLDNGNGIYNSIVVLNNMHGRTLKIHQQEVQNFVNKVMSLPNMPKTVAVASEFNQELKEL